MFTRTHTNTRTRTQTLGPFLCGALPFLTTWAILVNSFVLVAIALDRYVAVGKVWRLPLGWEPSGAWCAALATVAWLAGAAVAAPMVLRYQFVDVFIIETNPANRTEQIDVQLAHMCLGDKVKHVNDESAIGGDDCDCNTGMVETMWN